MKKSRALAPFLMALALLALPVLAGAALAAPSASEVRVEVVDSAFQPKVITIAPGDTIVWTNTGRLNHTVTASDGSWDSGRLAPGQTFSRTFDTPGTINYYCRPHGSPDGAGMAATIVVQAPSTGAPAPASQPAPTQAPAQPSGPTPTLDVSDQAVAGGSVTVSRVVAARDGWLVIHTNTADNSPGPVIGQTPVTAGENLNVRVALSQTPQPGDSLWPMLHIDAGQAGVYEFPGADAPVIVDGSIVMKQLTVLGAAPATLPNAGASYAANPWMLVGVAALALLLAGGLLLRVLAPGRR